MSSDLTVKHGTVEWAAVKLLRGEPVEYSLNGGDWKSLRSVWLEDVAIRAWEGFRFREPLPSYEYVTKPEAFDALAEGAEVWAPLPDGSMPGDDGWWRDIYIGHTGGMYIRASDAPLVSTKARDASNNWRILRKKG